MAINESTAFPDGIELTADTQTALPECVGPIDGKDSLDWLGLTLGTQRGVIGALVMQSHSGDVCYAEKDQALLWFVSTHAASAIECKQTETWLQYVALHDQLTARPNRIPFHDRLRTALIRARRHRGIPSMATTTGS